MLVAGPEGQQKFADLEIKLVVKRLCGPQEHRMKPKPQRYIDLNHSGSNGAKAPPPRPKGYS